MDPIQQEQLTLLARKAQLMEELKSVDAKIAQLDAFAQGYKAATSAAPQEEAPEE